MSQKTLTWWGMVFGSLLGGLVASYFDDNPLSILGVVLSGVGALIGLYAGYSIGKD